VVGTGDGGPAKRHPTMPAASHADNGCGEALMSARMSPVTIVLVDSCMTRLCIDLDFSAETNDPGKGVPSGWENAGDGQDRSIRSALERP
jgi:hypothetical protein